MRVLPLRDSQCASSLQQEHDIAHNNVPVNTLKFLTLVCHASKALTQS